MLAALLLSTLGSSLFALRSARREEAVALRELSASIEPDVPECSWFEEKLTSDSRCLCLVAESSPATLVGVVLAKVVAADRLPRRAHVSILVVSEPTRRRGCGRLLLERLQDRMVAMQPRCARSSLSRLHCSDPLACCVRLTSSWQHVSFRVQARVHQPLCAREQPGRAELLPQGRLPRAQARASLLPLAGAGRGRPALGARAGLGRGTRTLFRGQANKVLVALAVSLL